MRERDYSIDILKFLAVFLIINSHMDALYVKYEMLATGGAIGDVLFLFASGYTLLLSKRKLSFANWYKRRINRIYPSLFVGVLVGAMLKHLDSLSLLQFGAGGIRSCHYGILHPNVLVKEICIEVCSSGTCFGRNCRIAGLCVVVSI